MTRPVLLYVEFPFLGPFGEALTTMLEPLAHEIAGTTGLRWKIWTENPASQRAGGVYLFDDEEHARRYLAHHTERLHGFGVRDIDARFLEVNKGLSRITASGLSVS